MDDSHAARPDPSRGSGRLDPEGRARLRTWLLGVAAFVLVGWALHATAAVMVLLVFSLFLALMLWPLVAWVKGRVPERLGWLGHVAAALVLIGVAVVFVGGLWLSAQRVVAAFPAMGSTLSEVVPGMGSGSGGGGGTDDAGLGDAESGGADGASAAGASGSGDGPVSVREALAEVAGIGEDLAGRLTDAISGVAAMVLDAAATTLGGAALVFFLTLLMLVDAPGWRHRLSRVLDPEGRHGLFESAEAIGRQVRLYLLIRAAMGVLTAALYTAWLWVMGVDLLLVWALLTFLLSFVPNLGSIASGLLPTVYAFVTKDFGSALIVGAGLTAIEQVIGNFVDPKLMGRQVSVSPLVILVAILVWGWLWGAPGLLLAVPMTIAAIIVCAHVEPLRPVALLLSDRRSMEEVDELATR